MAMYTFSQWVLFFYIYCFLGWVWESAYVSIKERHLVNRGFLKGPLLPIYGTGALCILVVTIPFRDNVPLMCLTGMVSATVLEYVTGAVMEKMFHVRYWDYTGRFMNLNGHVCLASMLCWGVMTVLVVDVFQVYLERLVLSIDEQIVTVMVFAITPFVTADLVTSFRAAIHLRDLLIQWEKAREELEKLSERRTELERALDARRAELEKTVNEQRTVLEKAVNEQRTALEKAVNEQRTALEKAVDEQRTALEKAVNDQREALASVASECRQDLERAVTEKKQGLESTVTERVQGLEDAVTEKKQELQTAVNDSMQGLELLMEKLTAVQEKESRLKAEKDLMRQIHSKSVRGLLKRNPKAVSFTNKEAFADLKNSLLRKSGETKAEGGNDDEDTGINSGIDTDGVSPQGSDMRDVENESVSRTHSRP